MSNKAHPLIRAMIQEIIYDNPVKKGAKNAIKPIDKTKPLKKKKPRKPKKDKYGLTAKDYKKMAKNIL